MNQYEDNDDDAQPTYSFKINRGQSEFLNQDQDNQDGYVYEDTDENNLGEDFFARDNYETCTFDRLENMEADKTMSLLLNNDFRLFENQFSYEALLQDKNDKERKEGDIPPRYFSEGYEANVDQADDLELSRWQYFFPHMQIVGEGYEDPNETSQKFASQDSHFHNDGEILAFHDSRQDIRSSVDEENNRVIASTWPILVDSLKPLINSALQYAEQNDIPATIEGLQAFVTHQSMEVQDAESGGGDDGYWD
jgi:hypothetical protein